MYSSPKDPLPIFLPILNFPPITCSIVNPTSQHLNSASISIYSKLKFVPNLPFICEELQTTKKITKINQIHQINTPMDDPEKNALIIKIKASNVENKPINPKTSRTKPNHESQQTHIRHPPNPQPHATTQTLIRKPRMDYQNECNVNENNSKQWNPELKTNQKNKSGDIPGWDQKEKEKEKKCLWCEKMGKMFWESSVDGKEYGRDWEKQVGGFLFIY